MPLFLTVVWIDEYITVSSFITLDYKLVFAKGPKLHVTSHMKMACTSAPIPEETGWAIAKLLLFENKLGNIAKTVI